MIEAGKIEVHWKRVDKIRVWVAGIKMEQGCTLCDEDCPDCLDWHHLGEKAGTICDLIKKGWGRKRLLAEMADCMLLCANCHRKVHAGLIVIEGSNPRLTVLLLAKYGYPDE